MIEKCIFVGRYKNTLYFERINHSCDHTTFADRCRQVVVVQKHCKLVE